MRKQPPTLYQRALGDSFANLHPTLRTFHSATQGTKGSGMMEVIRGNGWFRNTLATLMGFPPAAQSVGILLQVDVVGEQERWFRWFGDHPLHTLQTFSKGLLVEDSGLVSLGLQVSVEEGNLHFTRHRMWFLGLPIPSFFAPHVTATTQADDGGWKVETTIKMWGVGLLVCYKGYISQPTEIDSGL